MSESIKNRKSELQSRDLFGNIKSIKEFYYSGVIAKEKKNLKIWDAMSSMDDPPFYDLPDSEKIVEEKLKNVEYSFFNKKGNLTEENSYDSSEKLILKTMYLYDKEGNIVKKTHLDNLNRVKDIEIYKYDNQSNKIEETIFDSSGNVLAQTFYTYDQNKNLLKEIENRQKSSTPLIREYKYKFDHNGNVIEETSFLNGLRISIDRYEYESNGNIIKDISVYNEIGELDFSSKEVINKYGKFIQDQNDDTYEYDATGNLIEVCHNSFEETVEDYSYIFDNLGNWVHRIERLSYVSMDHSDYNFGQRIYNTSSQVTITKREIEYYDNENKWWNIFRTK